MADGYENLEVQHDDQIFNIELNRPEVLNAVNPEVFEEITSALNEADNSNAKVVVITGRNDVFSAGGDINWMEEKKENTIEENIEGSLDGLYQRGHIEKILAFEKPIICKVNGDAVGAGSALATIGDIVVASKDARIGDPHVKVGYAAPDTVAYWPLLVGLNKAKELILTGDLIPADEAEDIGLVNYTVPPEDLDSKVSEIAEKLASNPQYAVRGNKMLLNKWLQFWSDHMRTEAAAVGALHRQVDDHEEYIDNFLNG